MQYTISARSNHQEIISVANHTNYTYCPLNLTHEEYLFDITSTNKAGNGSSTNITIKFQTGVRKIYNKLNLQ